jgi:ribosomal protein S18 acetylase RimI-like enzyme
MRYELRPVTADDLAFLWGLKIKTLKDYIDQTFGWDDNVAMWYLEEGLPGTEIVLIDQQPVGQLKVVEEDDELYLSEIGLMPQFQGCGIGGGIIRDIQDNARSLGKTVRLQVMKVNPAKRLYERLGFEQYDESETHYKMRWMPK